MTPFAGPLAAAALLLAAAGAGKVLAPDATRVALRSADLPSRRWMAQVLGAVEVVIGVAAIVIGGAVAAGAVAASYLGFAWFARRLQRASWGRASCGCFGDADAPVGSLHVALDAAIAVVVAGAVLDPSGGASEIIDATPVGGLVFAGLVLLSTWLLYAALTVLPATLDATKAVPAS